MPDIILSVKNASLTYNSGRSLFRQDKHIGLNNISFDLYRGETLGVIGRNGCGKSTLLKLLSGIYRPDQGNVDSLTRKISLLSLSLGFDPDLTGRENAVISGMFLGADKLVATSAVPDIIELSQLGAFIDKPVRTYSSGMRSRLGFAVAMNMETDIMLIDEVLSVGDLEFREKAEALLKSKIISTQTVVLVSHSLSQVSRLSDRVLWLEKGKVAGIGEPQQVLNAYIDSGSEANK